MALQSDLLLVSPGRVLLCLTQLCAEADFWRAVAFSFLRIAGGFLLASAAGILLAALSAKFCRIRELAAPLMITVRTIPVASFIILALIWFSSQSLPAFISFLMVLPVIYTNVLSGIRGVDGALLEMAQVFRIPLRRRVRYLYIPQVLPSFRAGCSVALGLCWKAGVAAEVIGIPRGSIGAHLQQAKVYLDMPTLFAWTLVIVLISLVFEKAFLCLLEQASLFAERMQMGKRVQPLAGKGVPAGKENIYLGDIVLENICKSLDKKHVLCNLSAAFPQGKTSCIMASSGAGKTTLLRILLSLESPDSGEVSGLAGLRKSAVFQEDRLCENLSPIANIRLVVPSLSVRAAEEAMEALGLRDCKEQPVRSLSGGMRRRVSLLRALLADWDVLFLDEPFQGLDEKTKSAVIDYTVSHCEGRTVLLVTHDAAEAEAMGVKRQEIWDWSDPEL